MHDLGWRLYFYHGERVQYPSPPFQNAFPYIFVRLVVLIFIFNAGPIIQTAKGMQSMQACIC